ncbi:MAG: glycosyltransferase family 39 protein [Polyangiales bacterium]
MTAFGLALFTLGVHLVFNRGYGLFRDEFYYLACGERLSWGYVDHPPLIALTAKLTRVALGESASALRLLPAISAAALVLLTASLARELGGAWFAQALACIAVTIAPIYLLAHNTLSMNAFEPLLWTSCVLVLARVLQRNRPRELLLLGPLVGFGLLNKHSMIWLCGGLVFGLLLSKHRSILLRKELWLGALIAFVIALPNLIWEVAHRFPTLEFMRNAQSHKNVALGPLEFVLAQVRIMHPLTAPLWLAGLVGLLVVKRYRDHRYYALAYLSILVLVIVGKGKPYYLMSAYPALFAIGAIMLERAIGVRTKRRLFYALVLVLMMAGGMVLAPLSIPILSIDAYQRYASWLHLGPRSDEKHRGGVLPQHFADMFGWVNMTTRVGEVVDALPENERARTAVFASNYGEAGAMEFYGRHRSFPKVISGHNNYFLWGPGHPEPTTLVTVGVERDQLEPICNDLYQASVVIDDLAMPYESGLPIFVCRLKVSLPAVWPRAKKYI